MLANDLAFEPEGHVYRYNGRVVPSVTQCLSVVNDLSFVNPARLEAARRFGVNVHLAVELWNRGILDMDTLDPALLPYLKGWLGFIYQSGFAVTASEQRIYNKQLGYAGCIDVVGTLGGRSCLADVKSGVLPRSVGPQTAAYQAALIPKPQRRLCVQLFPDNYRVHVLDDKRDFSIFVSCLNIYRYLKKGDSNGYKPCAE